MFLAEIVDSCIVAEDQFLGSRFHNRLHCLHSNYLVEGSLRSLAVVVAAAVVRTLPGIDRILVGSMRLPLAVAAAGQVALVHLFVLAAELRIDQPSGGVRTQMLLG